MVGLDTFVNCDTLRGTRREFRLHAGWRLYWGRPASGYHPGVRPPLDADVAEARDVIEQLLA